MSYDFEVWKTIDRYNGYFAVSNYGRIKQYERVVRNGRGKRVIKEKIFDKISKNHQGYCFVTVSVKGKPINLYLHLEVGKAFIPNKWKLPQINHKDENKENNCVWNLEWCTAKYNTDYGTCIKRRSEKQKGVSRYWQNKPILCYKDGVLVYEFNSLTEASETIGCRLNQISEHLNRPLRHKTVKGFVFKYKEVA